MENGSNPKGDYRKCQRIERIKYIQQDHGAVISAVTVAIGVIRRIHGATTTVQDALLFAVPVHLFAT